MPKKAAVVIGVDKPKGLTPLKAAASCAQEIAGWLVTEGFEVECITDKKKKVTTEMVETAIEKFVTVPTRYHLLLVYFSGHGLWHGHGDLWLLSGAPTNPSQAINLRGAMELAKYSSGIPNVVFVSDACRTIPDSGAGVRVKGVDAFPNLDNIDTTSKIDDFRATGTAQAAYEAMIDGQSSSLLTHALRSAYKETPEDMVTKIQEGGQNVSVVTNHQLEIYLPEKVNTTLATIDPTLIQRVECNVTSRPKDNVYIARASKPVVAIASATSPDPGSGIQKLAVRNDAANAIEHSLRSSSTVPRRGKRGKRKPKRGATILAHRHVTSTETLNVDNPQTESEITRLLPGQQFHRFESECGFVVSGAEVTTAICTKGRKSAEVFLQQKGDGGDKPATLRVNNADPGVSVIIRLVDGRGAILPALAGYIGHAVINESGLANVSYVPSSNNWRYQDYKQESQYIDRLRALVALAVDNGTFKVRSDKEATSLGEKIRMAKSMDPTLGLYAAHAFSQAGEDERIVKVLNYMRDDLQADLFDVFLLASPRHIDPARGPQRLPFCPILAQTWGLLRPRGIKLPEVLTEASAYLCNALWTTFEAKGAQIIFDAIKSGELK